MCMKRKYFLVLFGNDWINHVLSQIFSRVASNIHVEKLMGQVVFFNFTCFTRWYFWHLLFRFKRWKTITEKSYLTVYTVIKANKVLCMTNLYWWHIHVWEKKKPFFFIFDSSNYVILPLKVVWFNIITQNNVDNIILWLMKLTENL